MSIHQKIRSEVESSSAFSWIVSESRCWIFQEIFSNSIDPTLLSDHVKYLQWKFNLLESKHSFPNSKVLLTLDVNSDLCCFCKRNDLNNLGENFYKPEGGENSDFDGARIRYLLREPRIVADMNGCVFKIIDHFSMTPWHSSDSSQNLVAYHIGLFAKKTMWIQTTQSKLLWGWKPFPRHFIQKKPIWTKN